jgi:hypothetical protein
MICSGLHWAAATLVGEFIEVVNDDVDRPWSYLRANRTAHLVGDFLCRSAVPADDMDLDPLCLHAHAGDPTAR